MHFEFDFLLIFLFWTLEKNLIFTKIEVKILNIFHSNMDLFYKIKYKKISNQGTGKRQI